jgi:hypothetical protein
MEILISRICAISESSSFILRLTPFLRVFTMAAFLTIHGGMSQIRLSKNVPEAMSSLCSLQAEKDLKVFFRIFLNNRSTTGRVNSENNPTLTVRAARFSLR